METFDGLPSIQEEAARAKATFHARFLRTRAYQSLSRMRAYELRLDLLEEACWRIRCAETRGELKGARANRALLLLSRLKRELGEPGWFPEQIPAALDKLQDELQHLGAKRSQGRPRDGLGRLFRRNMRIFFPSWLFESGALSNQEIDEFLAELFSLATGRALSVDSYVRMRKRERAADNEAISASRPRRSISIKEI